MNSLRVRQKLFAYDCAPHLKDFKILKREYKVLSKKSFKFYKHAVSLE